MRQVRIKKDGQDYESDSLRIMVTSIDRYLKEQGYHFPEDWSISWQF